MENLQRLRQALKSPDATDRRYAAEDLEELGDSAAAPALIEALSDPVVAVREAAADALGAIGGPEVSRLAVELLYSEDVALRNFAQEILVNIGTEATNSLIMALKSTSPDVRKFGLDVLGKIGEINRIEDIRPIIALIEDENVNVAAAAVEALGRIGDEGAVEAMLPHLSGHPWMQCNILYALAQIGGEQAAQAVRSLQQGAIAPEARPYHAMATKRLGL